MYHLIKYKVGIGGGLMLDLISFLELRANIPNQESCKVVANLPENRESALLSRKLVGNSPRSRLAGAPIGHEWCDGGGHVAGYSTIVRLAIKGKLSTSDRPWMDWIMFLSAHIRELLGLDVVEVRSERNAMTGVCAGKVVVSTQVCSPW
ncbi:hypothetical protein Acr_08g0005090 [Actinidia rufa]|uniref:Uncharacterized protein n=1 Tax=Actinidia rufa TaxID=165716 RepID=A0A7J0F0G9_9ERIC|nr:hypothetical protein Acr_08g0005090 [Actinidia rufa]